MTIYAMNTANPELQAKLHAMVEEETLYAVSSRLDIGREHLLRYLANVSMPTTTFRGIEAILVELEPKVASQRGR
jgi:hypothetical protein